MLNEITLIGRIGSDIETKPVSDDKTVSNFSLATETKYRKDDAWVTNTIWHKIEVWGREEQMKKLNKGSTVCVPGMQINSSYKRTVGGEEVDWPTSIIKAEKVILLKDKTT